MSDINFCNTKEQLNHLGEVVTGKVDGSPTGADIDTSTLPYTGQVRKTLPALEGEYEQSITNKEAEADAAIDAYRLTNKGPYASGIALNSNFEYITYNGESYFAVNPPYTTTATTPDADSNLFISGYTTFENVSNKIGNKNELSNSNFLTPSPDAITHPNATPESYVAGTQIFSGVYAGDTGCTITLINGRVNCTAGDYKFKLPNTNGLDRVPLFTSSVSDYDGIPKTTGISHALVGNEYVVTVTPSAGDVFGVKIEQGSVATWHEVGSLNQIDLWRSEGDIRGWGAVGDYYLSDGSINPSPTDNLDAIKAALASGGNILGLSLTAPHGGFYCSEAIKVDYQTNNPWLGQSGIGRLSIKGKGIGSTVFIFPSSENDGMLVNTDSLTITNLDIGGFSLVREGFNPDNYQPRPYYEDFNFSSEPLYGEGLHVRHNGYLGGLEDIMISGFYVAFKQSNVYNGSIKRIFTPQGKAIYGFIGQLNTTLRAVDCNFWGYQASWVSSGGSNELQNIVCEGNMIAFEANPNLVDKFAGHSFYQSGGRLNMTGCYTEKSIGFARGLVNCIYFETDGTVSNGLKYHYNSTGSDGLSGALKAKIDIVNPNFISTYCQVTSPSRPQSTVMNSYMTINDVHWLEDSTIGDKVYTNIYSIEGCIPTSGGWENTINSVFINQIPSNLQMGESVNTWQAQQYQRPTDFNGSVGVINDYDPNYNGYGTFTVGRLTLAGDRIAKTGLKWAVDLGGNSKLTNFAIDSSGLSLRSNDSITILASGSVSFHLNLLPEVDSTGNIGASSRRWSNIYVVNAPIVGSDARLKDFFDVEDYERAAAIEIKSSIRKYKWNYKDKDDSRFHFGVSAQEVCEILRKHNLDPMAYSFVCYDELEDSQSDELASSYKDRYGIRYSELCMFILSAI